MKKIFCSLVVIIYLFASLPFSFAEPCGHYSSSVVYEVYEHYEHINLTLYHRLHKVRYWQCSVCGEIATETLPDDFIIEHCNYVDDSFFPENLLYDSTQHWYVGTLTKKCSGCDNPFNLYNQEGEKQNHSRGQAEDAGHVGVYHYFTFHCTVCGYLIETIQLPCPGGSDHIGYTSVPTDPNLYSE